MVWLELLDNPEGVRAIFPTSAPSLKSVRIHDVLLHQDGARLVVRLDLNDYPSEPPKKWAAARHNRVQLQLMFTDARELNIAGWSYSNVGDVDILALPDGVIAFQFSSTSSQMRGTFRSVRLDGVSAYRDGSLANSEGGGL